MDDILDNYSVNARVYGNDMEYLCDNCGVVLLVTQCVSPSTLVRIAHAHESVAHEIPFPEDARDYERAALWALAQPEIVKHLVAGKLIHAIKEARQTAPPRVQPSEYDHTGKPRTLSLINAKGICERARDILTENEEI